MTSKFDGIKHNLSSEEPTKSEDSTIDRFELLSAYLDGELSPSEKNLVQTWLDSDADFKQLYLQLLTLQGHLQHSAAPPSNKSPEEITTAVFQSLDRTHRWRKKLIWGGSALAASLIAGISGIIPGTTPFSSQMAEHNLDTPSSQVMLAVALDRPAINIPKSVTNYGEQTEKISD